MRKLLLVLALCAVGCKDAPPQARLKDTLPMIPLPEGADQMTREGGEDAVLIRFRVPGLPAPVDSFYRSVFSKPPWHLTNSTTGADGVISLYADGEPRPMWVRITPMDSTGYTHVELAGAKTE